MVDWIKYYVSIYSGVAYLLPYHHQQQKLKKEIGLLKKKRKKKKDTNKGKCVYRKTAC